MPRAQRSEAEALKALHDSALFEVSRNLEVPEGFQVELIYAVPLEEQGSWVALTPDAAGRLITSDQFGGLYRVTVGEDACGTTVEKLNVSIGHAQGLLYAIKEAIQKNPPIVFDSSEGDVDSFTMTVSARPELVTESKNRRIPRIRVVVEVEAECEGRSVRQRQSITIFPLI